YTLVPGGFLKYLHEKEQWPSSFVARDMCENSVGRPSVLDFWVYFQSVLKSVTVCEAPVDRIRRHLAAVERRLEGIAATELQQRSMREDPMCSSAALSACSTDGAPWNKMLRWLFEMQGYQHNKFCEGLKFLLRNEAGVELYRGSMGVLNKQKNLFWSLPRSTLKKEMQYASTGRDSGNSAKKKGAELTEVLSK
ncbi:unnamed protein product, partial [Cladocopium goreaui]